jgi:hypothetical protein
MRMDRGRIGIRRTHEGRVPAVLDATIALVGALALVIALSGGWRVALFGARVSIRDWTRPLALFAILLAMRLTATARATRADERVGAAVEQLARIGFQLLVFTVAGLWVAYLDTACGGLDSQGYVSTATAFLSGHISIPKDTSWLPFGHAIDALAPLGWVPAPDGRSVVPYYPPGFPVVMAAFALAFGAIGPYLVSPVVAAIAVGMTFAVARRVTDPVAAALAATLVAVNPVAFAYAIQPMSDITATCCMLVAAWFLLRASPSMVGAALAAGLAILVRPVLAPAALILPFAAGSSRAEVARYLAIVAGAVAVLLGFQWMAYGSPLVSGYGTVAQLFVPALFGRNVLIYLKWLLVVQTPLIIVLLWAAWYRGSRRFVRFAALVFAAVAAPYCFYIYQADDWGMLRFLMPGFIFLIIAAADGAVRLFETGLPRGLAPAAALGLAIAAGAASFVFLDHEGVFRIAADESRYPAVGAWFSEHTPADAVVLASLQSGSILHYSGRLTLRWDRIPPDQLAATVRAASRRGVVAFLALDGTAEREGFAARFGSLEPNGVDVRFIDGVGSVQIARLSPPP